MFVMFMNFSGILDQYLTDLCTHSFLGGHKAANLWTYDNI